MLMVIGNTVGKGHAEKSGFYNFGNTCDKKGCNKEGIGWRYDSSEGRCIRKQASTSGGFCSRDHCISRFSD